MYSRPLSKSIIEKLKQCHRMQQEGQDDKHCTMENMLYALAPLYKRGLIDVQKKIVDNKALHCMYLTQAGKDYLKNLED